MATLLADADEEEIQITGAPLPGPIHCCQAIGLGHKIAVAEIEPNAPIIKYGVIIGTIDSTHTGWSMGSPAQLPKPVRSAF